MVERNEGFSLFAEQGKTARVQANAQLRLLRDQLAERLRCMAVTWRRPAPALRARTGGGEASKLLGDPFSAHRSQFKAIALKFRQTQAVVQPPLASGLARFAHDGSVEQAHGTASGAASSSSSVVLEQLPGTSPTAKVRHRADGGAGPHRRLRPSRPAWPARRSPARTARTRHAAKECAAEHRPKKNYATAALRLCSSKQSSRQPSGSRLSNSSQSSKSVTQTTLKK